MKFVKQLPNRMKWPKILHIYQYFLKAYFARKCIVFFGKIYSTGKNFVFWEGQGKEKHNIRLWSDLPFHFCIFQMLFTSNYEHHPPWPSKYAFSKFPNILFDAVLFDIIFCHLAIFIVGNLAVSQQVCCSLCFFWCWSLKVWGALWCFFT